MNPIKEIQARINEIQSSLKNRTRDIYLNVINNEFVFIDGKIKIPKIPVKELDYELSIEIVENLIGYIPEFLKDHILLKKRKPPSEQHSLHFIKIIRGRYIYFIHIFKIDLKFGGDTGNIIEQGNSDFYPSYNTDRIYFKSRLIPENSVLQHDGEIIDFSPIRIYDTKNVETDQQFNTFAIFDEFNTKEISMEIANLLGPDLFSVSPKIYPFVPFDYFTATFNILNPLPAHLSGAIEIFEPLFIYIYSNYGNYDDIINDESLKKYFAGEIGLSDGKIVLTEQYRTKIRDYFKRFMLIRDDEMLVKGWRKFEIES